MTTNPTSQVTGNQGQIASTKLERIKGFLKSAAAANDTGAFRTILGQFLQEDIETVLNQRGFGEELIKKHPHVGEILVEKEFLSPDELHAISPRNTTEPPSSYTLPRLLPKSTRDDQPQGASLPAQLLRLGSGGDEGDIGAFRTIVQNFQRSEIEALLQDPKFQELIRKNPEVRTILEQEGLLQS